jgi:branched-chain amino acid transport system substrate-binding protein
VITFPVFRAVGVALLGLMLSACQGGGEAPGTIRIGAIASLTGPAGEQGKNWIEGAELAVEELRREGLEVKLLVENDETSAPKVAAAIQKLAHVDRVKAVIGGTWDYLAETAYPLAERLKVPFLTPSNPVEVLSEAAQRNRWVFSNGLSLRAARLAVTSFLKREGIRSLGLVYPALPFGTVQAEMLENIAAELGIAVTVKFEFAYDSAYLDSVKLGALKIAQQKPDLVFGVLDAGGVDLFLAELQKLRAVPVFLTTQHLDQAFILGQDPLRYRRAFGIYPQLEDRSFEDRFRAKYGRAPKVYAPQGYDALMFFAGALHAGVNFSDESAQFSYRGVTGEHRLPSNGRALVEDRAVIMTTRDGVFAEYR